MTGKVLIAGGAGLVGSATIGALLDRFPDNPILATTHQRPPNILDSRVEYCSWDLLQCPDLARQIEGCSVALLAVARSGGVASLTKTPAASMEATVALNSRLLQACVEAEVSHVVLCSSVTVYQPFEGFVAEAELDLNLDPPEPHTGVGWANRYCERLARYWSSRSASRFTVARLANVFGPYGVFDPKFSNFVPALIRKAVEQMDPFEVWGSPTVTRDVLYSKDCAAALIALMNRSGEKFGCFNVGSGVETTVGSAVQFALSAAGHEPRSIVYGSGPQSIPFRALNCEKIFRETGWRAQIGVQQGIAETLEWWKSHRLTWSR